MSKRFTETRLWEEDWFLSLPKDYQFFWFYLKDHCNHAGIFKPNVKFFNKIFEASVSLPEAVKKFNEDKQRILILKNGSWFLTGFIPFQYGLVLNENNRVHKSILEVLLLNEVNLTSIRPQIEVNDRVKDKDKDKDLKILNTKPTNTKTNTNGGPPKYCHKCARYFNENYFEDHLKSHISKKVVV